MRKKNWIYVALLTAPLILYFLAQVRIRQAQPLSMSSIPPAQVRIRQAQPFSMSWPAPAGAYYNGPMTIGFASDGHLLSAHVDGQLREWDITSEKSEKMVRTVALSPFLVAGSFAQLPTYSRDGKWGVAQGVDNRNQVIVWDLKTGQQVAAINARTVITNFSVDFSTDGKLLAFGGETLASAKDQTHKKLPDSTPRGWVEVWDWKAGRLTWSQLLMSPVTGVSWASNGDLAIAGGSWVSNGIIGGSNSKATDIGGEVSVWNPAQNRRSMQRALKSQATAVALSPDAKWVAVAQSFLGTQIWNARTGALHQILKAPMTGRHGGSFSGSPYIETVTISGDSRFVAGSSERGRRGVKVWKTSDGGFVGSFNTAGWRNFGGEPVDDAFALSQDGKFLAVSSSNSHEISIYPLPKK